MADYRIKRIESLKQEIVDAYSAFPEEYRKMTLSELSEYKDSEHLSKLMEKTKEPSKMTEIGKKPNIKDLERIEQEIARIVKEGRNMNHFVNNTNLLVDIKELNFDATSSLEEIVEIIKKK